MERIADTLVPAEAPNTEQPEVFRIDVEQTAARFTQQLFIDSRLGAQNNAVETADPESSLPFDAVPLQNVVTISADPGTYHINHDRILALRREHRSTQRSNRWKTSIAVAYSLLLLTAAGYGARNHLPEINLNRAPSPDAAMFNPDGTVGNPAKYWEEMRRRAAQPHSYSVSIPPMAR